MLSLLQCSKSCGNGIRKRVVACVANNIIVSDSKCDLALKPYHMESCSVFPCPFWRYGQWSEVWKVDFNFIDVLLHF